MSYVFYLASPFSDPERRVRETRYSIVLEAAGALLKEGILVYSPIVHNYEIAVRSDLDYTFQFWQIIDKAMIDKLDGLLVLTIPGWRDSRGVQAEIAWAKFLNKHVDYVRLDDLRYNASEACTLIRTRAGRPMEL